MPRSFLVPGFRFHPTDVELVMYHLKRKLLGKKVIVNVITEVNIYDYCPQDLPDKSPLKDGDLEWYFFCPKSKKYTSGSRINRTTEKGFWKATGRDRKVKHQDRTVATIKTLIFHVGHAGKGERTDWVMHEYRMEDEQLANEGIVQDTYVLCKIFKKSGLGPKNGAQYGATFNEDEWDDNLATVGSVGASHSMDGKQKGPATSMTEPGSSVVTFSANEPTNEPNTINMTEPGSFTFSANEPTNTLNYQENGSAMTELGSSVVLVSSNGPTNTFDYKQKSPATNMGVPHVTHGFSVQEPGSSSVPCSTSEMPANDDVIYLDDIKIPEDANGENVQTMGPNDDYNFLDELMNLDDFHTDGPECTLDELLTSGDPDLGSFIID
ncbi:hypothetical protein QVD17_39785 [Tagetes erecta]|uniref:NAC domain-containing protein n=1 Tax=Tagetes erecta TaxID=13708 RepID=A0AAD8NHF8_TARER|nr:hypothetical protein QVD17_39785 [Tagetes erecta]